MKKILSIGLLTVCALAFSEHQASAWVNSKFSVGLNWHVQSANNNVLWGMWKNGQVPGPEAFGGGAPYGGPIPFGTNPPAGAFPYYGAAPQPYPQAMPAQAAPPQPAPQQAYYGQNPYQAVSYQNGNYYYNPSYYTPSYYPNYDQGYGYQAPYYWYQGR